MGLQSDALINLVVQRAGRGEFAAAADEAEALLNSAGASPTEVLRIVEALHRALSPHALANDALGRVGVSTSFSPSAKLPSELKERLDKEKAAVQTFYRRLLEVAQKHLGSAHDAVMGLRDSLIMVCDVLRDPSEAVHVCEQALTVAQTHPDAGQESVIQYCGWLSRLYKEAGQFDKAETVYDQIAPCQHLQPLLEALRAGGIKVKSVRGGGDRRWFLVGGVIDPEEIKKRLNLPNCVRASVEDFAGPHAWDPDERRGLVCQEDGDGIFGEAP